MVVTLAMLTLAMQNKHSAGGTFRRRNIRQD
ncbi:MAG: hypothetical protein RLZZ117_1629 [Cyanobacteriota bacterium]|jgi:hypothetical protein